MKRIVKKTIIIYLIFGVVIGIGILIFYLLSDATPFYVGSMELYGLSAGAVALICMPVIMIVVGAVHGVIIWYPLVLLYNKFLK